MNRRNTTILIILAVLILDQVLKFWVKLNMHYGEDFGILGLSWARMHFIENEGMAFGMQFGGQTGKIILSVFRLAAAGVLVYVLHSLIKNRESYSLIISVALIFAGAFGNIIDSAFYGMIFSESYFGSGLASLFPEGGGYAPFLMGRVVDMLYFPLIETTLPEWIPIKGGERFLFFRPVFNIADSAITTGVISLLLFNRSFFKRSEEQQTEENTESSETPEKSL